MIDDVKIAQNHSLHFRFEPETEDAYGNAIAELILADGRNVELVNIPSSGEWTQARAEGFRDLVLALLECSCPEDPAN